MVIFQNLKKTCKKLKIKYTAIIHVKDTSFNNIEMPQLSFIEKYPDILKKSFV